MLVSIRLVQQHDLYNILLGMLRIKQCINIIVKLIIMRIPKNCSFYCISMSAISHDLTRCVESTKIGGNPKAVNKISQAQNSLKLLSSLQ